MKQGTPLQPRQGASCPLQPRLRSVRNKRIRMFIKFGMTHVHLGRNRCASTGRPEGSPPLLPLPLLATLQPLLAPATAGRSSSPAPPSVQANG
jgi:hypothetical protein